MTMARLIFAAITLAMAAVTLGAVHPTAQKHLAKAKPSPSSLWAMPHSHHHHQDDDDGEDGDGHVIESCTENYVDSYIDHFTWTKESPTYRQRYFICGQHWNTKGDKNGPIFFYTGNEADVTLYLNATGFMWEFAPEMGALLVFAEHRYYGKSQPFGKADARKHLEYLSSEQALADYADLIFRIKLEYNCPDSPVIAFGGSYGGMLSSWFRMKYPHIVDGAFAASAPIWSFLGEQPRYDPGSFAQVVTYDATAAAGAHPECAGNVRKAFKHMADATHANVHANAHTDADADVLSPSNDLDVMSKAFRLCDGVPLSTEDDVASLMMWAQTAFDYMAMGNYPYASDYILNGDANLPAFPMRVACDAITRDSPQDAAGLMSGLAQAAGVFYNASGDAACFDYRKGANPDNDDVGELWDYQFCTEMFMPSSRDGVHDMFWDQPWDISAAISHCRSTWNVSPRPLWPTVNYGGKRIEASSNIVFSNGEYDPWQGGGVLANITDSIHAVFIPGGAHHIDFMWSTDLDPPAVIDARTQERNIIRKWVEDAYNRNRNRNRSGNRNEVRHGSN